MDLIFAKGTSKRLSAAYGQALHFCGLVDERVLM